MVYGVMGLWFFGAMAYEVWLEPRLGHGRAFWGRIPFFCCCVLFGWSFLSLCAPEIPYPDFWILRAGARFEFPFALYGLIYSGCGVAGGLLGVVLEDLRNK